MEDGTVFTITDETVFGVNEDHTDGVKEVSEEIASGNHIQGYLNGGNTAKTIYENNAPAGSGKIRVDFEGVAAAVDGSVFTLEDGRTVTLTAETNLTYSGQADGQGEVFASGIAAGDFIQGAAEQMTASTVFIIPSK